MYFNKLIRYILLLLFVFLLSCSRGLDHKLITDSGDFEYEVSLQKSFKNMSRQDIDFFNFMINQISDIDSLENLDKKYHNKSPRYIIKQEIKEKKYDLKKELEDLEIIKNNYDEILKKLLNIKISNVYFYYINNVLEIKPIIRATITNLSSYDISSIYWKAKLYINNDNKSIAIAKIPDIYNSINNPYGAMLSNKTYDRNFELKTIKSYKNGKLLTGKLLFDEIRKAKKFRLTLDPILETAKDVNGKNILPKNPYIRINEIKEYLYKISINENRY